MDPGRGLSDMRIACDELNRRGWPTRLTEQLDPGAPGPRLQTVSRTRPLAVQLLDPSSCLQPQRWEALRCTPTSRTRHTGPLRADVHTGLELARFVVHLLEYGDRTGVRPVATPLADLRRSAAAGASDRRSRVPGEQGVDG